MASGFSGKIGDGFLEVAGCEGGETFRARVGVINRELPGGRYGGVELGTGVNGGDIEAAGSEDRFKIAQSLRDGGAFEPELADGFGTTRALMVEAEGVISKSGMADLGGFIKRFPGEHEGTDTSSEAPPDIVKAQGSFRKQGGQNLRSAPERGRTGGEDVGFRRVNAMNDMESAVIERQAGIGGEMESWREGEKNGALRMGVVPFGFLASAIAVSDNASEANCGEILWENSPGSDAIVRPGVEIDFQKPVAAVGRRQFLEGEIQRRGARFFAESAPELGEVIRCRIFHSDLQEIFRRVAVGGVKWKGMRNVDFHE